MRVASDLLDVIAQPLYDTATIPAAGSLQLNYFATPLGQGQSNFGAAGVTKQLPDTNMTLAGQLAAGYNFDLMGFAVQPAFTMTALDAARWSVGAALVFTISSKPYLQIPIDCVPQGNGPTGAAAVGAVPAAGIAVAGVFSHGSPMLANIYSIRTKPLLLQQTQNFSVQLQWVALSPVTSVVPTQPAAGLPVRVYLHGFTKRIVQ